jgi:hypothetical protein
MRARAFKISMRAITTDVAYTTVYALKALSNVRRSRFGKRRGMTVRFSVM